MTKIYKLRTDISVFKEIPLDAEEIAEVFDMTRKKTQDYTEEFRLQGRVRLP